MVKKHFIVREVDTHEWLASISVEQPENDYLGEKFYDNIRSELRILGLNLKFYTVSNEADFNAYAEHI
jgi:hypothetical protein